MNKKINRACTNNKNASNPNEIAQIEVKIKKRKPKTLMESIYQRHKVLAMGQLTRMNSVESNSMMNASNLFLSHYHHSI